MVLELKILSLEKMESKSTTRVKKSDYDKVVFHQLLRGFEESWIPKEEREKLLSFLIPPICTTTQNPTQDRNIAPDLPWDHQRISKGCFLPIVPGFAGLWSGSVTSQMDVLSKMASKLQTACLGLLH